MADIESSKDKSNSWGGAREGAGRPKGSMNDASKIRAATKAAFIERINKNADKLFNAQYDLAIGEKYLMVKRVEGEGKNRKTWVEIVTDLETIKSYIDDDGATLNEYDEDYYYMTTKPANNLALDSLLNRSFGRAEEKLVFDGEVTHKYEDLTDEQLERVIQARKDRAA